MTSSFTVMPLPVVHDEGGEVSRSFTPANAQSGVVDRTQVVVTSNLVIACKSDAVDERKRTIVATVHYQACTATRCLYPTKRQVVATLDFPAQ